MFWLGQRIQLNAVDLEFNIARVYFAHISLGTGDGEGVPIFEHFGCVHGANDGRNAQLSCDNGCMAGAASFVGDDRR